MPVEFPPVAPTLSGSKVTLVQLEISRLDDYVDLIGDEETSAWTASSGSFTIEQLTDWLQTRPGATERLDWAIIENATQEFVGEIVLNEFDAISQSMNMRIALMTSKTSRGLGTQALELVVRFAFESLGVSSLTLEVLKHNERAIRSYTKCGFLETGEIREDGQVFLQMKLTSL